MQYLNSVQGRKLDVFFCIFQAFSVMFYFFSCFCYILVSLVICWLYESQWFLNVFVVRFFPISTAWFCLHGFLQASHCQTHSQSVQGKSLLLFCQMSIFQKTSAFSDGFLKHSLNKRILSNKWYPHIKLYFLLQDRTFNILYRLSVLKLSKTIFSGL